MPWSIGCRKQGEHTVFEHWWEELPGEYWSAPDFRPPGVSSRLTRLRTGDGSYGGGFGNGFSDGFGGGF
ncbi:hypothetical protein [Streptomyces werraensis]|uniref:hypothetical protein n=1 Tax=Streptomyces werraensis TaxID=68284 RepID=UPI001CE2B96E